MTTTVLVLASTGKTGSRLATALVKRGIDVRAAARAGADVRFDWDDPSTHEPALRGVDSLYLVPPVMRLDYAGQVSAVLDLAEAAGVRHVTFLSAYGVDQAPPQAPLRAIELDLIGRDALTHSLLRPAWFMQNFSETFLKPVGGSIVVPTGDGTEAFVDVEDIAAVAAETLAHPEGHAGAAHSITGPEAITVAEAAAHIAAATGKPLRHHDIDREAWIAATVASGVAPEYADVLRTLTGTIASGAGSRPTRTVEEVTGTPPTTFADFARRTAGAWA